MKLLSRREGFAEALKIHPTYGEIHRTVGEIELRASAGDADGCRAKR